MVSNVRSDHTLILTLITVSDGVVGRTTQYKYCPHLETTSTSAILGSPSSIRHVSLSNEDLSSSILNLYRSRFIPGRNIRGISLLTGWHETVTQIELGDNYTLVTGYAATVRHTQWDVNTTLCWSLSNPSTVDTSGSGLTKTCHLPTLRPTVCCQEWESLVGLMKLAKGTGSSVMLPYQ